MAPVRVVIFAKFPAAGLAKTRLIPVLGSRGAAELAQAMLVYTVSHALAADIGPVELCVTPAVAEADWAGLSLPPEISWRSQGDGDLGDRMARCVRRLAPSGPVILIGTDAPALTARRLGEAADALTGADVVMIPAVDGGYVLLGVHHCHSRLFSEIAWSTASVAEATRARCRQLQWRLRELPVCHDIDEPADLQWLPPGLAPAGGDCPRCDPGAGRIG